MLIKSHLRKTPISAVGVKAMDILQDHVQETTIQFWAKKSWLYSPVISRFFTYDLRFISNISNEKTAYIITFLLSLYLQW